MSRKLLMNNSVKVNNNIIYLYNRGNLCDSVTGGWTIGGTKTTLQSNYIEMIHASGNCIDVNNKLNLKSGDVVHIKMCLTGYAYDSTIYGFKLKLNAEWTKQMTFNYIKDAYGFDNEFDFVIPLTKNYTDATFELYGYYGSYKIYEVYIEKVGV